MRNSPDIHYILSVTLVKEKGRKNRKSRIDAMNIATSALGPTLHPQTNSVAVNLLFFTICIQLGAIVVLMLFVR